MPNMERRREAEDELEIASRVMDTVQRQIASYRLALEKVRMVRKEFAMDQELAARVMDSPENMADFLVERGVPDSLAVGMAAEDFKAADFGGRLGLWTWDCCCTSCCLTECHCTLVTSIGVKGREAAQ